MAILRAFALFFGFAGMVFLLSVATLRAEDNRCDIVANAVSGDGGGVSFYDRRALSLYRSGKLQNGDALHFFETRREELVGC